MNAVLAERYQRLCTEESDIYEHLPTFVQAVEDLQATRVVELGTRYGVSTIAWLYALERQDNAGHLWSVDCSFPVAAPDSDVNLLDPQGPLGVIDWWTFILGYDTWAEVLNALPQSDIDILFIDTNHVYEETLIELDTYYPRVRRGGRIFLHDTAIQTTGNAPGSNIQFPVRTAVQEFCTARHLDWHNATNCFGLGCIYV